MKFLVVILSVFLLCGCNDKEEKHYYRTTGWMDVAEKWTSEEKTVDGVTYARHTLDRGNLIEVRYFRRQGLNQWYPLGIKEEVPWDTLGEK
jgi:hypothetical protein